MSDELTDSYKITSFRELLNHLTWSWDYPTYDIQHYDGEYCINKLYISKDRVSYKTSNYALDYDVFTQFESFYNFLQMVEKEKKNDNR